MTRPTPFSRIRKKIVDNDVMFDIESYPLQVDTSTTSGLSGYGTLDEIRANESFTVQFINASQLFLFDNFNVVDTYILSSFARYLLDVLAREYGTYVVDIELLFSTFTAQFAKFAKMNGFNSILSPELIANNKTDMQFLTANSNIDMSSSIDIETLNTTITNLTKEKELLSVLGSDQQGVESVNSASNTTQDIIQNVVASFNEIVGVNNANSAVGGGSTTQNGTMITGNQNFGLSIPLPEISATSGGSGQLTGAFLKNQVGNPQLLNTNINSFSTSGEVTGTTQQPTYGISGTNDGNVAIQGSNNSGQDSNTNASEQSTAGKIDTHNDNVTLASNNSVGSNFLQSNNNNTQENTGTNNLTHDVTNKGAGLNNTREVGYRQSPLWTQNLINLMRAYNDFNINSLVIDAFAWLKPMYEFRAWGDDVIYHV